MGIDGYSLAFLLESKQRGCSFENTMMIGRQILYRVGVDTILDCFRQSGPPITNEQAEQILQDKDGYVEPLLEYLGARRVDSIDFSAYENATVIHDMNQPIPEHLKGKYTCVLEGGSLEHVFNFPQAIKNCMEMVAVGGSFLVISPANNFMGHGFYQFSPELFYRLLSPQNGFAVKEMLLCELDPGAPRHRVKDPVEFGGRITLQNRICTHLMLMASRTHAADILSIMPQQSDYGPKWSGHEEPDRAAEVRRSGIKALIPYSVRKFVRRFRSIPDPFASDAYERIK